jgi:hypothetical protein
VGSSLLVPGLYETNRLSVGVQLIEDRDHRSAVVTKKGIHPFFLEGFNKYTCAFHKVLLSSHPPSDISQAGFQKKGRAAID